jgi:exodeoxyribonuclease VII small subunit
MPPRKKKDDVSNLPYEKALEELKAIVGRLEVETPSLEEAIQLFERGQVLAKHCAVLLSRAELKVRRVSVPSSSGPEGSAGLESELEPGE